MIRCAMLVASLMLACGAPGAALPSFTLVDVNTASALHGQAAGPASFRGRVSGWYFLHTT